MDGHLVRVTGSKRHPFSFLNTFSSLALRECCGSFYHIIKGAGQASTEGLR